MVSIIAYYPLQDNDYWDGDEEFFVIHLPSDTQNIPVILTIKEDEVDWHCCLLDVEYIAQSNVYKCNYGLL